IPPGDVLSHVPTPSRSGDSPPARAPHPGPAEEGAASQPVALHDREAREPGHLGGGRASTPDPLATLTPADTGSSTREPAGKPGRWVAGGGGAADRPAEQPSAGASLAHPPAASDGRERSAIVTPAGEGAAGPGVTLQAPAESPRGPRPG